MCYFLSFHGKEFLVQLKINDHEILPIRCILYQISPTTTTFEGDEDHLAMDDIVLEEGADENPDIPPLNWQFTFNEPIFEDQRNQLYLLPRHPLPMALTDGRSQSAAAASLNMSTDEVLELVRKYTEWKDKRDKDLYDSS